jgi:hypothetical protein
MELSTKEDCQQAKDRINAWWNGEVIDRAVVMATAPKAHVNVQEYHSLFSAVGATHAEMLDWFTNEEAVIQRLEKYVHSTYWGGEAIPYVLPVSVNLVAITAAYLGCPYHLFPGSNSAWAEPVISDWDHLQNFSFDPENEWWKISRKLLNALSARAQGQYYIGVPDLNGPGEMLALLRGTQTLAIDLLEHEPELFRGVIDQANFAWLRYWQASVGAIHQWVDGYMYWMGIWSDRPSIDLQNDFCCMISPKLFNEIFLPSLEQQTQWVERTIYHLDGPGAIRHLDALLSLPRLSGIQWVPGAGSPPMSQWLPLLRRIQTKGKLLALNCEPWEVEALVTGLEPEGLLLSTSCASEEEARELLKKVNRWSAKRKWMVT